VRCTGQGWPAPDPLPTTVAPADDDAGRSTQRWQQQQQQQRTLAVANAWGECFTLDRSALVAGALCLGEGFLVDQCNAPVLACEIKTPRNGPDQRTLLPGPPLPPPTVTALRDRRPSRQVSRAFPSCTWSIMAEIYLCHACSYQEIEDGNAWTGCSEGGALTSAATAAATPARQLVVEEMVPVPGR
jgi:hypothetical protein